MNPSQIAIALWTLVAKEVREGKRNGQARLFAGTSPSEALRLILSLLRLRFLLPRLLFPSMPLLIPNHLA